MSGSVMLYIAIPVLFSVVYVYALENLALNKSTWQEHPWPDPNRDFGSDNAVDGMYTDRGIKGQCTMNVDGYYTAEWRVDLGSIVSISYINIYYRTDNLNPGPYVNRMAGFSLYVSNTTSKDQGHLCYKDQSGGLPSVNQNISCSTYGRYVIYYNERSRYNNPSYLSKNAYNELCELEVHGYRRSYGDCCQNPCPQNCLNGECDAYTGHCKSCHPGYYGQFCTTECMIPYYGKSCSDKCSAFCNVTGRCDKVTGRCDGGCKPGWTGNTCDQKIKCDTGYFGPECRSKCGYCLESKHCHHINGSCLNGCLHGYRGDLCNETCPSGLFGLDCINRCDTYCTGDKSCDPVIGICNEGCKKGWSGLMCGLDRFSNRQPCGDNKSIVINIVLSVVIVLIGSVINCIYWRRKTVINIHASNSDPKADNEDTSQQYTELEEVNNSSNYDELYNYSN